MENCPQFSKLINKLGQKQAFLFVERILKQHEHTANVLAETNDGALERWRCEEKNLVRRLRQMNTKWNLGLTIEDTAKRSKCGDVVVTNAAGARAIWDCKDYSRTVPFKQMQKLARDVRVNEACFGVMITKKGVARAKPFTKVIVDGVPIHVTTLESPGEFACLYLSALCDQSDARLTKMTAHGARVFELVRSMEKNIEELKKELITT